VWYGLSEHVWTSATRDIFSGRLKTGVVCTNNSCLQPPTKYITSSWFTPKSVSLSDSIVIYHFVSINYFTLNKLTLLLLLLYIHLNIQCYLTADVVCWTVCCTASEIPDNPHAENHPSPSSSSSFSLSSDWPLSVHTWSNGVRSIWWVITSSTGTGFFTEVSKNDMYNNLF